MGGDLEGFQHCQCRCKRDALLPVAFGLSVEALDQIDVTAQKSSEVGIRDIEITMLCEPHVRELDAANGIAVVLGREFCDPGRSLMLRSRLGARTAERRARLEQSPENGVQSIN